MASEIEAMFPGLIDEPYEARGIIHSEMALIMARCRKLGVRNVIESGRARGQSTYIMAKYMPDVHVYSIEARDGEDIRFGRERLASMPNVTLLTGDGALCVEELASSAALRTAVLLDGPKGAAAVEILQECFLLPDIVVGFIHDMRKLDHGGPSPHRAAAEAAFPWRMYSDHPVLVERYAFLDTKVIEAGGPCGPEHEKQYGSYGPTVGVFLP
jgi:hypothetical protein